MLSISRDVVALIRIFTSCLTAAFLIFFISSLSGEDLVKNNSFIDELDNNIAEITRELESGIEDRIKQLGEVPAINPYKKFYCAEFAKEIHEVSYLTEKQKITLWLLVNRAWVKPPLLKVSLKRLKKKRFLIPC